MVITVTMRPTNFLEARQRPDPSLTVDFASDATVFIRSVKGNADTVRPITF